MLLYTFSQDFELVKLRVFFDIKYSLCVNVYRYHSAVITTLVLAVTYKNG
jgi:hypothetical protein